jgi:dipeptidyl aminopeptidase/acylaminoacyl peptidase
MKARGRWQFYRWLGSVACSSVERRAIMRTDIRATDLYSGILQFCSNVRRPGTGQVSDCSQLHTSPDRKHIVFAGTVAERVEEEPPTRITLTELATGSTRLLTDGPNSDKLPRFSTDGRTIAFLSDRHSANDFQLYILDRAGAAARATPKVAGSVEYLQWSADGTRILLGVVGPTDPAAGTQSDPGPDVADLPSWMPRVEPTDAHEHWRSCWIYELATDSVHRVITKECNVWGASWYGNDALAAVTSDRPGEGYWYSAHLCILDLATGQHREIYAPLNQLGAPVVAPSGAKIAIVEALCSDRGPVAGDLNLIDTATGNCRKADTRGVDVLNIEWHSEQYLLVSGTRGFETVVGLYDVASAAFSETWSSQEVSVTGSCVSGLERPGDCVLIVESFQQAPQIAIIRDGQYRQIRSFDVGYAAATNAIASVERISWPSTDGLEIQGWLLRPYGSPPFPLIINVHGGPVGHWRPAFLIRRMLHVPILLSHGYAVFLPNPRGSSGRGQEFAHRVLGDLGGADALDLLSGLDFLIERGVADPGRVGVTGVSYGGFMTAWLITQNERFAAAVAVSPHTNQVTAQLLSNIPQFMSRLLGDDLSNPNGRYFERSPVLHVKRALAPTLNICGALDRCTPPEEAIQFHHALLETGTESVLVTYPQEGHGIRRLPAALDCAARVAGWFIEHIQAAGPA